MTDILEALVGAVTRALNVHEAQRGALPDLLDPTTCPDAFLPDLAHTLGLTNETRLRAHYESANDPAAWRQIIALLPEIWKAKGDHETTRRIVRAACGARCFIGDWHHLRLVLDAAEFPFYAAAAVAVGGEYWTEVHVEDRDGTLDRDRCEDALALVRPLGERFNLTFVDALENWAEGLGRYTMGGTYALDAEEHFLSLGPDGAVRSEAILTGGTTAAWDHETYNCIARVAAGSIFDFNVRYAGGAWTGYTAVLNLAAGSVQLARNAIVVATSVGAPAPDADARVTLTTSPVGGGLQIDVWVDGAHRISHLDAAPLAAGTVRLWVPIAGGSAEVAWWEAIPGAPETRIIIGG